MTNSIMPLSGNGVNPTSVILPPPLLGYPRLEDWAQAAPPLLPVYAMQIVESAPAYGSIVRESVTVTVQQRDASGVIHYCRLLIARFDTCGGEPFGDEAAQRARLSETAWPVVRAWLIEAGYDVIEATFATPKDYRLLDGRADFLALDPKRGYSRRDPEWAALLAESPDVEALEEAA